MKTTYTFLHSDREPLECDAPMVANRGDAVDIGGVRWVVWGFVVTIGEPWTDAECMQQIDLMPHPLFPVNEP